MKNIERKILTESEKYQLNKSEVYDSGNYWKIKKLEFNGNIGDYDLSKKLLGTKSQYWHLKDRMSNPDNFGIEDLPLYHALFKHIFNSDNLEVINFVKDSLGVNWLYTATEVRYGDLNLAEKDKIIHNVSGDSIEIDYVGEGYWLTDSSREDICQSLMSDSTRNVMDFYGQIGKKGVFLERVNNPISVGIDEQAIGLDLSLGRFSFYSIDPKIPGSCFGVRRTK